MGHLGKTFNVLSRLTSILVISIFLFIPAFATPPAPANDAPCSATNLSVGSSCSYISGTTVGATSSIVFPNAECGDYQGNDVWYKFTPPVSGRVIITTDTGSITNLAMALYTTSFCGAITWTEILECDEDDSDNGDMPMIYANGLSSSTTYYIRVWQEGNTNSGTFSICAYEPSVPGGSICGSTPDSIASACDLGTLVPPAYCSTTGAGSGTNSVFNLSSNGADAENPYLYMGGCSPSGQMSNPAADIWLMVEVTGAELQVNISGLNTPQVALYEGSSSNPQGVGCAIGSSESLNHKFKGLTTGDEYFLQIAGASLSDTGAITLTLRCDNACNTCIEQNDLTVSPAPVNGVFPPSTPVTFTYTVLKWEDLQQNYLHGIIPTFGPGWDVSTLSSTPATACDGSGNWAWYTKDSSTASGLTFGPGFFYDSFQGGPLDGTPGNNHGDNCSGGWTFAFTVTTQNYSCFGGSDLSVSISNTGDGQSGSWDTLNCNLDPSYNFQGSITCVLPVDLLSFSGKRTAEGNLLNWSTDQEIINDHFDLERSTDGQNWQEIKRIEGHGTTVDRHDYEYLDRFTKEGTTYYRLKQTDFNGNSSYSSILPIRLEIADMDIHRLYPNPVKDKLNFDLLVSENADYVFRLADPSGKNVRAFTRELPTGVNTLQFEVSDLPSGMYMLEVSNTSTGRSIIRKFVK